MKWNTYRMHHGQGYRLTNEQAMVLFRILDHVMGEDGGRMLADNQADFATAMSLYAELGAAMPKQKSST